MVWVAEIQEHTDYFKDNPTNTTTFLAETEEDAKRLVAWRLLENLEDNDFNKITDDSDCWYEDMRSAITEGDALKVYEVFYKYADLIFAGEYVSPTVEICVYKKKASVDVFNEEQFKKLCGQARESMGEDDGDVEYFTLPG